MDYLNAQERNRVFVLMRMMKARNNNGNVLDTCD